MYLAGRCVSPSSSITSSPRRRPRCCDDPDRCDSERVVVKGCEYQHLFSLGMALYRIINVPEKAEGKRGPRACPDLLVPSLTTARREATPRCYQRRLVHRNHCPTRLTRAHGSKDTQSDLIIGLPRKCRENGGSGRTKERDICSIKTSHERFPREKSSMKSHGEKPNERRAGDAWANDCNSTVCKHLQ